MMLRTFMRHTDGLVLSFTIYFCKLIVFFFIIIFSILFAGMNKMMLRAFISVSKFVASRVESVAWTVAVPHTLAEAAAIPT